MSAPVPGQFSAFPLGNGPEKDSDREPAGPRPRDLTAGPGGLLKVNRL